MCKTQLVRVCGKVNCNCYLALLLFTLGSIALPCRADHIVVQAKPTERGPVTPLDIAVHQHKMLWLPPVAKSQQLVFEYLHNNGVFTTVDYDYPRDGKNIENWFSSDDNFSLLADRYQYANQKGALGFLSQDLSFAQGLLKRPDESARILGLRIVYTATDLAKPKIQSPWLVARIYDGFLLPNLGEAYTVRWREFNQQQMLENASFAYDKAGELKNEVAALQFLVQYTNPSQEADWARMQTAKLQAAAGQYEQAIASLKDVRSPDMKGSLSQITIYDKLQSEKVQPKSGNMRNGQKNKQDK